MGRFAQGGGIDPNILAILQQQAQQNGGGLQADGSPGQMPMPPPGGQWNAPPPGQPPMQPRGGGQDLAGVQTRNGQAGIVGRGGNFQPLGAAAQGRMPPPGGSGPIMDPQQMPPSISQSGLGPTPMGGYSGGTPVLMGGGPQLIKDPNANHDFSGTPPINNSMGRTMSDQMPGGPMTVHNGLPTMQNARGILMPPGAGTGPMMAGPGGPQVDPRIADAVDRARDSISGAGGPNTMFRPAPGPGGARQPSPLPPGGGVGGSAGGRRPPTGGGIGGIGGPGAPQGKPTRLPPLPGPGDSGPIMAQPMPKPPGGPRLGGSGGFGPPPPVMDSMPNEASVTKQMGSGGNYGDTPGGAKGFAMAPPGKPTDTPTSMPSMSKPMVGPTPDGGPSQEGPAFDDMMTRLRRAGGMGGGMNAQQRRGMMTR